MRFIDAAECKNGNVRVVVELAPDERAALIPDPGGEWWFTIHGLEEVELHWNGIEQAIDVYGDGRPEQYDASMPLVKLVELAAADRPVPALPEETPQPGSTRRLHQKGQQ